MRRAAVVVAMVGGLLAAQAATLEAVAGPPCIRVQEQCFPDLPAALAAAKDGDTVRLPAGRFPGGVQITRSITLQGAGAQKTVLTGGEHVLTIGTVDAASQPTVTIQGLTLTDGKATSSPADPGPFAAGGGLQILPAAGGALGGTVTVVDSVIRGNTVQPATQVTDPTNPGWPKCPGGPGGLCPFAGAFGGGVDNWGNLTLRNSRVSDNTVGGALASDADGGGIITGRFFSTNDASVTLDHSAVTGNRALAGRQSGRFAEGGGIFTGDGTSLTLQASSVSGNESRLVTDLANVATGGVVSLDLLANGGGVHAVGGATIVSSHIDSNTTSILAPNAEDGAIAAGLQVDTGRLVMRDSTVSNNALSEDLKAATNGSGGAFQWAGVAEITDSQVLRNTTTVTARSGNANATGAVVAVAIPFQGADPGASVLRHSVIADNHVTVIAPGHDAQVLGGGMMNDANTVLDHVRVMGNVVTARSATATLQGGGIWNGAILGVVPDPPSQLTLTRSRVRDNVLTGPPGATLQGGGLYTEVPVTLQRSRIAGNRPDECFGC